MRPDVKTERELASCIHKITLIDKAIRSTQGISEKDGQAVALLVCRISNKLNDLSSDVIELVNINNIKEKRQYGALTATYL